MMDCALASGSSLLAAFTACVCYYVAFHEQINPPSPLSLSVE